MTDFQEQQGTVTTVECPQCGEVLSSDLMTCPRDGTQLVTAASAQPEIGLRYETLSLIGSGGMSEVYLCKDKVLKREVAVKVLRAHLVSNPQSLRRFQQEAQAASALDHPHVIRVYDFGVTAGGLPYQVMDYLEGISLGDLLKREGCLPAERAVNIFEQVCDALEHAHERGVVHRDLKPSNIMLIPQGAEADIVKIVDFGIAKLVNPDGEDVQKLTQTGEVFGSPIYMSPEQCRGEKMDNRSDIYSMGCVMYETLTGKPPLVGNSMLETLYKHMNDLPDSIDTLRPELKHLQQLDMVIYKALQKDPAERQQSMHQLKQDLIHAYENSLEPLKFPFNLPGVSRLFRRRRKRRAPAIPAPVWVALVVMMLLTVVSTVVLARSVHRPAQGAVAALRLPAEYRNRKPPGPVTISAEDATREARVKQLINLIGVKDGNNSPKLIEGYRRLVKLFRRQGRHQEASEYMVKILFNEQEHHGHTSEESEKSLDELTKLLLTEGKWDMAARLAAHSYQVKKGRLSSVELGIAALQAGQCAFFSGDLKLAKQFFEEGLALTGDLVPDTPLLWPVYSNLGEIYRRQGAYEEARRQYERALTYSLQGVAPDDVARIPMLMGLADSLANTGDADTADQCYREALQLAESKLGRNDGVILEILDRYGDFSLDRGNWPEGVMLKARAVLPDVFKK